MKFLFSRLITCVSCTQRLARQEALARQADAALARAQDRVVEMYRREQIRFSRAESSIRKDEVTVLAVRLPSAHLYSAPE